MTVWDLAVPAALAVALTPALAVAKAVTAARTEVSAAPAALVLTAAVAMVARAATSTTLLAVEEMDCFASLLTRHGAAKVNARRLSRCLTAVFFPAIPGLRCSSAGVLAV